MDESNLVWQAVKLNKYCSCGYKCDCLQLIVKNKISTKRLFLRLEQENESDINLALSLNEFGVEEILNQFNHFKYCKAYHSIFHEKNFNQIKRKPNAFFCLHHLEPSNLNEETNFIHQLIKNSRSLTSIEKLENENLKNFVEINLTESDKEENILENLLNKQNNEKSFDLIETKNNDENNIISESFNLDNTQKKNSQISEEIHLHETNSNSNFVVNNKPWCNLFNLDSVEIPRKKDEFNNKFSIFRKYLNPFFCLLNILLIIIDFSSDILIARYHFVSENYVVTSITTCFIYWAAYMHFLFDTNFSKKLDLFRRKFRFVNLNNISTDLIIGIVHLFLPVKIFLESIYLVYNMYKWELRLINCRNEEKHQDIEVALRVSLRKAHKSNLIVALFEAFPQFLLQLFFAIYCLNDKRDKLSWLHVITIISSLVTYIKNSYCGDLYYIEDNLNKNFEELRFLDVIKFNYLPFKFNIVLFIYNLTEFLLNFPFFLIFYRFTNYSSILSAFYEYDFYFFIFYVILFFKSYVTFFKNYLTLMKFEKDEDANWKKDVLCIRKKTHSHVNYFFLIRLFVSCIFLISLRNTLNSNYYFLIIFFYFMLLAITTIGYILKVTIIADQLINLKNFYMWKGIFCHLENLNGFSIYNEKLFIQWVEKIIFENYYFQWKVLLYNAYHIFFKKN